MATIRLKEWTKERIDAIMDEEDHSSHDSVAKSLLKDREYANSVRMHERESSEGKNQIQPELAVLADLNYVKDGLLFLYCPNCGEEVAHIRTESHLPIGEVDLDCPGCQAPLRSKGIIAVSLDYPSERLENGGEKLIRDFQEMTISYWNRALRKDWSHLDDSYSTHINDLADEIHRQYREFGDWDWPTDTPVVTLETGRTYSKGVAGGSELWHVKGVEQREPLNPTFIIERRPMNGNPTESVEEEIDWWDVRDEIIDRRLRIEE